MEKELYLVLLEVSGKSKVIYAHNIKQLRKMLREYKPEELILVFKGKEIPILPLHELG